jgi:pimeloyl-ACP methyl ester carboxylesterase
MRQLIREGVKLCFEEAGSGAPPLVFVHGWTCDHTFFAPQFEYFGRAHRVIALDLRGHGASDKPQQDYTMAALADDVSWLCEQLSAQKPVVIGHSMGGLIALVLAARYPDLPAAIVTLDSLVVPTAEVHEVVPALVAALRSPAFREVQRQFVSEMLFLPTDDADRKARILDTMSSAPQHVMASAFEHLSACDTAAVAAACKIPFLALYAEHVFSDLAQLRALCPHVITGQTVGAGHFHQLEAPEQINAMIERFLAAALPKAGT